MRRFPEPRLERQSGELRRNGNLMIWSPSLVVTVISVAVVSLSILLDRCLKYYWKDARTRQHKITRRWLIGLSILSVGTALVLAIIDKSRAEKQSQRLARALKEAEDDRKAQAFAGRFETQKGLGQVYIIGDSGAQFLAQVHSSMEFLHILFCAKSVKRIQFHPKRSMGSCWYQLGSGIVTDW
jgi:hypothetical protein